jgi:hypothetical protein
VGQLSRRIVGGISSLNELFDMMDHRGYLSDIPDGASEAGAWQRFVEQYKRQNRFSLCSSMGTFSLGGDPYQRT